MFFFEKLVIVVLVYVRCPKISINSKLLKINLQVFVCPSDFRASLLWMLSFNEHYYMVDKKRMNSRKHLKQTYRLKNNQTQHTASQFRSFARSLK